MKLKIFFIGFFLILSCWFVRSQSVKDLDIAASNAYRVANYYGAAELYQKAFRKDSTRMDIAFKLAESYRLDNDFQMAEYYYRKVLQKDSVKYNQLKFWLADVLKGQGKYMEVKKYYLLFLDNYQNKKDFFALKANHEIEVFEKVIELSSVKNINKKIKIEQFKRNVNSAFSDFSAVQVNDTLLLYTSVRPDINDTTHFYSKIYQSIKKAERWTEGQPMDSVINQSGFMVSNFAFSKRLQTLYFTRTSIKNNEDGQQIFSITNTKIFSSTLKNGKWQKPVQLSGEINKQNSTTTHPTIAMNNGIEYLLFSSDREGGKGKFDIWYTKINPDGTFNEVKNMTDIINSPDDEVTPFYNPQDTSLYFSSKWYVGLGGFDIFRSKGNFTTWEKPVNAGNPVNSPYNDLYYTMNENNRMAYFSSNRMGSFSYRNQTCCSDIYFYPVPQPEKENQIKDSLLETGKDSLTVAFLDQQEETMAFLDKLEENTTEIFNDKIVEKIYKETLSVIELGKENKATHQDRLIKKSPEFLKKKQQISDKLHQLLSATVYFPNDEPEPQTRKLTTSQSYSKVFDRYKTMEETYKTEYSAKLSGAEKEKAIQLVNNFFRKNMEHGFSGLQNVCALLTKFSNSEKKIIITLKGYCSPLASVDYNRNLAQRRMESILNFLRNYNNGVLRKYLDNHQSIFVIQQNSIGEQQADKSISDSRIDKINSIYSPEAAQERRVEIEIGIE